MKSNVMSYTDQQLLKRVSELDTFKGYPQDKWAIFVRSNEDEFNVFDDKVYLFEGTKFLKVWRCTTNAGKNGLEGFETYNSKGVAVLKADVIIYDSHKQGKHKGKVMAYRQAKGWPYFRDNDKDQKAEEIGEEYTDIIGANIHPASYNKGDETEKKYINGWSLACLVFAIRKNFDTFMEIMNGQEKMTTCILQEFEP